MFNTVLLAIDPNHEESWVDALPRALDIVRQSGGTLHLAVVVPDFGMSMVRSYFPEDFEATALKRAKDDLDAFAAKHLPDDVKRQDHIGHGDVDEELLRLAETTGADLIVIGAQKHGDLRTFFLGSHADRIVHRAPISVLVVRE